MANVFVDMDLATGNDDGTTWEHAFQVLGTAFNGSNVAAGDDVWVMGSGTVSVNTTLAISGTDFSNPAKVHAVLSTTTNEPPVTADLLPGWRTGESRTIANRAYKDADPVIFACTAGSIRFTDAVYWYGFQFESSGGQLRPALNNDDNSVFEECLFEFNGADDWNFSHEDAEVWLINCGWETANTGNNLTTGASIHMIGLEHIATAVPTNVMSGNMQGVLDIIGCDFSGASGNIVAIGSSFKHTKKFLNCKLHASATLVSGSIASAFRVEFVGCNSTTGKSSGSFLDLQISTDGGDILDETTAVRTGGASDGEAGGHSAAFTPTVNETRDNYKTLIGPWMAFWVTNAKTSVTVYIANSGAGDYNDDDVWLEVMDVSEGGTAQHTHLTTQMDLLATPAVVADDTDSTWGTGGDNRQKIVVTISPDFSGWAYCRVHFAKNFGASPETLYVDPLPETA